MICVIKIGNGNGEESVTASAQTKDDIKPTKTIHSCKKFFTFWELSETCRKFLSEVKFYLVSRSIKCPHIQKYIISMETF